MSQSTGNVKSFCKDLHTVSLHCCFKPKRTLCVPKLFSSPSIDFGLINGTDALYIICLLFDVQLAMGAILFICGQKS